MPSSHILALPLELRLMIYAHLLVYHGRGYLNTPYHHPSTPTSRLAAAAVRAQFLTLAQTNRQTNREASIMYYGANAFYFACPHALLAWLQATSTSRKWGPLGRVKFAVSYVRMSDGGKSSSSSSSSAAAAGGDRAAWLQALAVLGRQRGSGAVRRLVVYWSSYSRDGVAGRDTDFVRGLARLRGLQGLVLQGFYARWWPAFLALTLALPVVEDRSDERLVRRFRQTEGDVAPWIYPRWM